MKEYTTAELAAALNCSKRTIQDWQISRKGKPPRLPADHVDEHGNNIFTEAQLEIARAFTDRTKKKNSQGQTLFDTDTPADKTQDTHEEIVGDVVDSDEHAQVTDMTEIVADDANRDEPHAQKSLTVTDTELNYQTFGNSGTGNADTTAVVIAPLEVSTLPELEFEIKYFLDTAARNFFEVGRRLIAAKDFVPHGQWQDWLENNFSLKRQSAQNMMAVAARYEGKYQTFGILSYSTYVKLLALPVGDEDEFFAAMEAAGTPVNKQSARELQRNVATWKKRNERPDPSPVESHIEDSDAGKLFVGGKPIDSVVAIVPVDNDEDVRDDASEDNQSLEQKPAPETQGTPDSASKTFDELRAALLSLAADITKRVEIVANNNLTTAAEILEATLNQLNELETEE